MKDMPKLPTPCWARDHHGEDEVYTADDMKEFARQYAAQEVAKEREACAEDIEHEASLWKGDEDISNFRLAAARVRARTGYKP